MIGKAASTSPPPCPRAVCVLSAAHKKASRKSPLSSSPYLQPTAYSLQPCRQAGAMLCGDLWMQASALDDKGGEATKDAVDAKGTAA